MAQHDYDIANGTGAAVRTDLNNVLAAVVSQNSGSSEPSTTFSYQQWADTANGLLKIRNGANNAWVTLGTLDAINLGLATLASPSLTGSPTAPTPASGNNTTLIATTAFIKAAVDAAVTEAQSTLTDAMMPAGSVVQVVNVKYNTLNETTSTNHVGSGLTASITPSNSANKILVLVGVNTQSYSSSFSAVGVTIYRGSGLAGALSGTNLAAGDATSSFAHANSAVGSNSSSDQSIGATYLDSPASTSSVAYTVAFRRVDGSGTPRINGRSAYSTMTLMEIKG
jgi:hypothetical protein